MSAIVAYPGRRRGGGGTRMTSSSSMVPVERIEAAILLLRGQKVLLDADLAALYGVETKALVRAVKRNIERFPEDFMLQLTKAEFDSLRCQTGTSNLNGSAGTTGSLSPSLRRFAS